MPNQLNGRIIGIRHRVKRTATGEARPTQVSVIEDGEMRKLDLETEQDELNFIRLEIEKNDRIAMVLGGSGNSLAYGLTNAGEKLGAKVFRIPGHLLKKERETRERDRADDAGLLALLLKEQLEDSSNLFYEVRARDRGLIEVTELFRARTEAMKARIGCEQRLHSQFIGKTLRGKDGPYPEGAIEDLFDAEKASNIILQALEKEEKARNRDLEKALEELDVYTEIFKGITGCGPAIAAGIIAAVGDIRRFETMPKFKAFLGVHCLTVFENGEAVNPDGGAFPRKRRGQVCNWSPAGRQALYLFGDQMVKRKDSTWGLKQREYKVKLREKHPEVLTEGGKKRYTDGHIHKMAIWKAMSKFAEWLYREWWRLEGVKVSSGKPQLIAA